MSNITVTGLADLQKMLDTLPAKVEANIMRGALRNGIKQIKDAAVSACPVGPPSPIGRFKYKHYEGALRDSIRISTRIKNGVVSASLKAGGKLKNGADIWYAHIIEFTGAVPHVIKEKHNFSAMFFGGSFYEKIEHPGMKAKPFLRPALESRAQDAVVAAGEYIKKRLATKEGLDTADIWIEGES